MNMPHRPSYRTAFMLLAFVLITSACFGKAQEMVGARPASRLPAVVESYLQKYQPGPNPRLFQTTYLYDRNGVQLAELFGEGRRTWVALNRMSQHLINATVATEDASFYDNMGIDPLRIAVAAWQNHKSGGIVSGASTITMQLARNLFLGPEDRYNPDMDRKVLEVGLAQELTTRYTKAEILEMYLNLLNYGSLAYGPEAAAQTYFGKSAEVLDLAESTMLAGIPQAPGVLNPYRNYEAVKARQKIVLSLMVKRKLITERQAEQAYRQPVKLRRDISPAPQLAPHFVQYVIQSINSRMGDGYLERAGFNLFTTLDLRVQEVAEKTIREQITQLKVKHDLGNAALVAMRPGTGEIVAFVGSADFSDESIDGQVNMALSPRQPGSSFKPLLFATAFSDNLISPASIMWDVPVTYDLGANQFYKPINYDEQYHGLITTRTALANSYNVPAVRLLAALGTDRMVESGVAMGLHSLKESNWFGLGMALGSNEVPLLEMVNAFRTIANHGLYHEPEVALTILDSQSQLIHPLPQVDPTQAISPASAFMITDILSDNDARTPMFGSNSPLKLSRPAAAKTGTTNDFRDNWTIGFTRHLVVGVWAGNATGQVMKNVTGVTGAAPIWHNFNERILNDATLLRAIDAPLDNKGWDFTPPSDVVLLKECPPSLTCRGDKTEYFSKEWIRLAGAGGPLADSFEHQPTVPVYVNRSGGFWPIYCARGDGEIRHVLRLSSRMGLPGWQPRNEVQTMDTTNAPQLPFMNSLSAVRAADGRYMVTFYPENELERMRQLRWARSYGMAVSVGDCSSLEFYEVQPGDFWSRLSSRFSLTTAELQAANPHLLRGDGVIHPGDTMLVPTGTKVEVGNQGRFYVVRDGDSWLKIANEFNLPMKLLQLVNPDMMRPYFILKPGDEIFVPATIKVGF